jgi:hypothetical protein
MLLWNGFVLAYKSIPSVQPAVLFESPNRHFSQLVQDFVRKTEPALLGTLMNLVGKFRTLGTENLESSLSLPEVAEV